MDRTDVDTMPAGREMDALVAERVMGSRPGTFLILPYYSTDIAAAWEVVKAVRQKREKCWVHICNVALPPSYELNGWDVIFHEYGMPLIERASIYGHGMADTLPLAISRAALKLMSG